MARTAAPSMTWTRFLVVRYDTVFTAQRLVDRRGAGGIAVEVCPRGEVRVITNKASTPPDAWCGSNW